MKRLLLLAAALSVVAVGVLVAARVLGPGDAHTSSGLPQSQASQEPAYYVAKRGCSNSGPGTASQPFCSIQRGVDRLRPGDTLQIGKGTYRGRVTVRRSGSADAPM
ncbi:hypothetical protein LCGC14_1692370, partial [marine sediment metagenome]